MGNKPFLIKSRKGFIEDAVSLIISAGIAVIVVIGALWIINSEEKTKAEEASLEQHRIAGSADLAEYLSMQDNSFKTNANIISDYALSGEMDKLFEQRMKTYFDLRYYRAPAENNWRSWHVAIVKMPGNERVFDIYGTRGANLGGVTEKMLSNAIIPSADGRTLAVRLYARGRGSVFTGEFG